MKVGGLAISLAIGAEAYAPHKQAGKAVLAQEGSKKMPTACFIGEGFDYLGLKEDSATGRRCKKWIDVKVEDLEAKGITATSKVRMINDMEVTMTGDHAFCRNIEGSGETEPFCFTMDPGMLTETCAVEKCDPNGPFGKADGYYTETAEELSGTMQGTKDLNCDCADELYGSTTTTKDTSVSFLQGFLRKCPCAKKMVAAQLKPLDMKAAKKGDCDCINGKSEKGDCDCINGKEQTVSAVASAPPKEEKKEEKSNFKRGGKKNVLKSLIRRDSFESDVNVNVVEGMMLMENGVNVIDENPGADPNSVEVDEEDRPLSVFESDANVNVVEGMMLMQKDGVNVIDENPGTDPNSVEADDDVNVNLVDENPGLGSSFVEVDDDVNVVEGMLMQNGDLVNVIDENPGTDPNSVEVDDEDRPLSVFESDANVNVVEGTMLMQNGVNVVDENPGTDPNSVEVDEEDHPVSFFESDANVNVVEGTMLMQNGVNVVEGMLMQNGALVNVIDENPGTDPNSVEVDEENDKLPASGSSFFESDANVNVVEGMLMQNGVNVIDENPGTDPNSVEVDEEDHENRPLSVFESDANVNVVEGTMLMQNGVNVVEGMLMQNGALVNVVDENPGTDPNSVEVDEE